MAPTRSSIGSIARLGGRYPAFFLTLELQTAFFITAGTLALFTFFYNAPSDEYLRTLAVIEARRSSASASPCCEPTRAWRRSPLDRGRARQDTRRGLAGAVGLPLDLVSTT